MMDIGTLTLNPTIDVACEVLENPEKRPKYDDEIVMQEVLQRGCNGFCFKN